MLDRDFHEQRCSGDNHYSAAEIEDLPEVLDGFIVVNTNTGKSQVYFCGEWVNIT